MVLPSRQWNYEGRGANWLAHKVSRSRARARNPWCQAYWCPAGRAESPSSRFFPFFFFENKVDSSFGLSDAGWYDLAICRPAPKANVEAYASQCSCWSSGCLPAEASRLLTLFLFLFLFLFLRRLLTLSRCTFPSLLLYYIALFFRWCGELLLFSALFLRYSLEMVFCIELNNK